MTAPLLLHVFPTFDVGGAQVRTAALMNRFGRDFRHRVVSLDGGFACAERLGAGVDMAPLPFPAIPGERLPARLARIRAAIAAAAPARIVTSNWGSIEWAMANRWPPRRPLLHMEDGFGPDEATGQKARRVWTRRLVLRGSPVLLPSLTLLAAARGVWRLPERDLVFVPNGIDLARFTPEGPRAALDVPGEGPLVGGGAALRLVVIGDGPERPALEALAARLGLPARFPGHVPDPAAAFRALDLFALSSDTEQMPFSVLEAMGTALPVVATDVGDVRAMLPEAQGRFVVPKDAAALGAALAAALALGGQGLAALGAANRARAERDYDQEAMFQRHRALWEA